MMKTRTQIALVSLAVGAVAVLFAATPEKSSKLKAIPPKKVADLLHSVIAADRHTYARDVVQRLQDDGILKASEAWQEERCLPVPAQLLRTSARSIQSRGAEFSYALRSLWPINPKHGPQTTAEAEGLRHVYENPEEPYYHEEMLGGRSYFTAIYADVASLPSCVSCHNGHAKSPRSDFRQGEVMGGIVVRLPLEF